MVYSQIPLGSSRLETFDMSSCAVRQARTAKMHWLDTFGSTCRTCHDEPSGIWAYFTQSSENHGNQFYSE